MLESVHSISKNAQLDLMRNWHPKKHVLAEFGNFAYHRETQSV